MKDIVVDAFSRVLKEKKKHVESLLEVPPRPDFGDYAFPCFSLAATQKKSPLLIAQELAEKLRHNLPKEISGVSVKEAYVNVFVDKTFLAKKVFIESSKKGFGTNNKGAGKTVVFDMSSPNIAKPFGIGHLRSTIIGNALVNLARANGYKTFKINYLGDWGTQFGKMILGFKRWGEEKKLEEEPIKHLYEIYVKSNSKEYEEEAREEFKKLEQGDKESVALWKKFKTRSLREFDKLYKLLGVSFDVVSGESEYNNKMETVIKELTKKKIVKKDDGALIVDLKKEGLGVALLQKSDGTSLYHTRDLAAALDRHKKYAFDSMIYEVGQEQTLYFRQLFRILEKMGYPWAKQCVHTGHGLYLGKDGKKFATRKGKTVFMEEVLGDTIEKAKKNLAERGHGNMTKKELERRARIVALAAILYGDLKVQLKHDVVFDIDKFLQFEGDTGPYLLYAYARASTMLKKVKGKKAVKILDLKVQEIALLKKIHEFSEVVEKAYKELSPNLVANYAYELAKLFNEFYHACPVLGSIEEGFRLKLVEAFKSTLGHALKLLGMETLEEM